MQMYQCTGLRPNGRVVHIGSRVFLLTLTADISAVANRMIFLSSALERARRVVIRTYQVIYVTPSSRGDIIGQKSSIFMKNQWKMTPKPMILSKTCSNPIQQCYFEQNV